MKMKQIVITILISALVGTAVWFYKPKEATMNIPFPYTNAVNPEAGISCEAIVGSNMYGGNNPSVKGITAELFKGTDKIAISVNGDKFKFLTRVALEAGETDSDEGWTIARNDKKHLIAVLGQLQNPLRDSVNIFMLNKENGMATWTETRATNLGTDMPEAQSYLLQCR